jgi:hypothetical protein
VLSGTVQKLGNLNKFAVDILDILDGSFIDGYEERYTSLSQGVEVIPKLASQVSGVKVSSTSTPVAQPAANTQTASTTSTAQSANGIGLSINGIQINKDPASTVNINVGRENINGQEKEVLTLDIRLAGGEPKWAGVANWEGAVAEKLQRASGIRFKALGDGKKWALIIPMRETGTGDGGTHRLDFTTQRGKVADIDIPFSRLKQPEWGKRVTFNKNSVSGMQIERTNNHGSGAATIKVFDIELY